VDWSCGCRSGAGWLALRSALRGAGIRWPGADRRPRVPYSGRRRPPPRNAVRLEEAVMSLAVARWPAEAGSRARTGDGGRWWPGLPWLCAPRAGARAGAVRAQVRVPVVTRRRVCDGCRLCVPDCCCPTPSGACEASDAHGASPCESHALAHRARGRRAQLRREARAGERAGHAEPGRREAGQAEAGHAGGRAGEAGRREPVTRGARLGRLP